jgi:Rrf2 family iron-sulfur cluster assembly transcriptional regulator
MRLTRAGEYAIRCVLYLAGRPPGEVSSRREVAAAMDIPDPFLSKIAQQLAKAGLIEIIQGAKGGYRLLLPPEKVTLLDVVETISGEIFLNDCLMRPGACSRSPVCKVHQVWQKAREQLRETLRQATIDRLLGDEACEGDSEDPINP